MTDFGGYDIETATEIYRRVLGRSSEQQNHRSPDNVETQGRAYWVQMQETLLTALDSKTGYSQAPARVLRYLIPQVDTLDMEDAPGDTNVLMVTNRDISLFALVGGIILVIRNGSEWNPITQPGPIWAVNIGDLEPATHPLTGYTYGTAALLKYVDPLINDDLEVTNIRTPFIRRDESGTIDDGTLIMLDVVQARLAMVWADCAAFDDFTGLDPDPSGGTTLGGNGRVWE